MKLTYIRSVSTLEAKVLLALTGVSGVPVRHRVDCYRMAYPGVGSQGEPSTLSGLLALPRGVKGRRLVSFQHGTATTRSAVPSNLDGTGLAAAIVFAGNGYGLVAPDYPGMGSSPGRHPYYVPQAIGPAIVGMIAAAQTLAPIADEPVFLSGFSEGGWASLQALKILEAQGRPVLGAAPVAAAIDTRGVSLPVALKGGAKSHALYLAYLAWGQAGYYRYPLESVLTPEYAARVDRLFSAGKPKQILAGLPTEPKVMFNRPFLDAYDQGGANWLLDSISAAGLTELTPRAPVRLYYGSKDIDVVPQDATAAASAMRARGAEVTAIDVGPKGHDGSMLAAAPLILAWLGELDAAGE